MAFKKLGPAPSSRYSPMSVRMRPGSKGVKPHMDLTVSAHNSFGKPSAVFFEWDEDECLLRIVASSTADPAARKLGEKGRVALGGVFTAIGVDIAEPCTIPVTADGPLALIADLSEYVNA